MTEPCSPAVDCPAEYAVLQTLAYFEVFQYPLREEELLAFCAEPGATPELLTEILQNLLEQGRIYQFGAFFQLTNNASWASKRLEYNRRADAVLPRARRMAGFIAKFPFVRAVFVSGSLSKHCMRPESDVDFFIVTSPGRLWVARTALVLFKKIFLLNSHKYFCVNYFVDTEHLEVEEKNLFTATESVTLLPMWGVDYYDDFCRANTWAWQRFPHCARRSTADLPPVETGFFKKMLESLFSGRLGNWLDQKTMQLTVGFWKRKFRHLDADTFDLALKSRRGVSKHHPLHFQQKVLDRFEENLRALS